LDNSKLSNKLVLIILAFILAISFTPLVNNVVSVDDPLADPVFNGENPADGSTGVSLSPRVNVTVSDSEGDTLVCDFYTSDDGVDWTHVQRNGSVDSVLDYEDFESGSDAYDLGDWTSGGFYWTDYVGTCGARVAVGRNDGEYMEFNITASDYTDITLDWQVLPCFLEGDEFFNVLFFDGEIWSIVEQFNGKGVHWVHEAWNHQTLSLNYLKYTFAPDSKIRFVVVGGADDEDYYCLDCLYVNVTSVGVLNESISYVYSDASSHSTSYYWKVTAYDGLNWANNTYSFTTKRKKTGGRSGGGSSDDGGDTEEDTEDDETNLTNPPTADPNGPYTGLTYQSITFNGSGSSDDGTIVEYIWDFGDGSMEVGVEPTHTYTTPGIFIITLTVIDDMGLIDSNATTANILIDTDNDSIADLDDEDDDNDGLSDSVETLLGSDPTDDTDVFSINIEEHQYYLVDIDGDGISDKLYDTLGRIIEVEYTNDGKYLLDINGDDIWDYVYDPFTGTTEIYSEEETPDEGIPLVLIIVLIIVIGITIITILYKTGYIWIEEYYE
jgi:hypothetical protein